MSAMTPKPAFVDAFGWVHPADGGPPVRADAAPQPISVPFSQVLSALNPLQHVPVVGRIYRAETGDEIPAPLKVMGAGILGGPLGILGAGRHGVVHRDHRDGSRHVAPTRARRHGGDGIAGRHAARDARHTRERASISPLPPRSPSGSARARRNSSPWWATHGAARTPTRPRLGRCSPRPPTRAVATAAGADGSTHRRGWAVAHGSHAAPCLARPRWRARPRLHGRGQAGGRRRDACRGVAAAPGALPGGPGAAPARVRAGHAARAP